MGALEKLNPDLDPQVIMPGLEVARAKEKPNTSSYLPLDRMLCHLHGSTVD